jgi:adenylate cyclase
LGERLGRRPAVDRSGEGRAARWGGPSDQAAAAFARFLLHPARNAGHVVSKQELAQANWPDRIATDDSLARCVSDIRAALGPQLRHTLRTASGRGYSLSDWNVDGALLLAPAADGERRAAFGERPSIAVLPFVGEGDDGQSYFADGVTEEIIAALSRVRWLFVIARSSSFAYRGRALDARRIAAELGVRYLLEGTVRRDGGRVRITGQLVEAGTGRQLWTGHYDGDMTDIFALQERIAASVLSAVEPNLRQAEIERARSKPPGSIGAYDLYLQALPPLYAYTQEGFREAERLLRAALERDAAYSDALAALADCIGRMALNGWLPDREAGFVESRALARRAVLSDPGNPISLATAAWSYAMFSGEFDDALELADRALALHPNSLAIRSYCGWVFAYAGQSDRAIEQFEAARQMSPVDPRDYFPLLGIATAHFFARRFDAAARLCERIIALVPSHTIARRYLCAALAHAGRAEAGDAAAELLRRQPDYSLASAGASRFRHPWMLDLYVSGLREAGIPER